MISEGSRWTRAHGAMVIILIAAFATRAVTFGNPLVDMDDQFYWLVGRSIWQGDWPILDIWDRKPVGLFLIYGAIAGIDRSILAVQIAATLFAGGTAVLIRAAALHIASPRAALLAAVAYLFMLPLFGGQSGQSPVFYNLFIAASGLLLLSASIVDDAPSIRRRAFGAMLLSGAALVIKQVSVAEGVYFGLAFLFLLRRAGEPNRRIVATAAAMIALALLPTLLGIAGFAFAGEGAVPAYIQASYLSIFAKSPGGGFAALGALIYLIIFSAPLLLAAGIGVAAGRKSSKNLLGHRLVVFWIAAAFVGYILVPSFFAHYALPLLVPLSVMAARAFDQRIGRLLFIALLASCLLGGRITDLAGNRRAALDFDRVAAVINQGRRGGCLYVANGPVGLYAEVPACRLTKYLFPYHLTLPSESSSIGVDQQAEIERIFAARPSIVVTQDNERPKQSIRSRATIDRNIDADYRLLERIPVGRAEETLRIWQRRDLARSGS